MSITITEQEELLPECKRASKKQRTRKSDRPFHGVRKRKWGRYVSEIRMPGQKTRIWLGSFVSPEMAARAYDSAAFFLKGNSACLNFPNSTGLLPRPLSCSRKDIQLAAARAAVECPPAENGMGIAREKTIGDPECMDSWDDLENLPFEEVKKCPLVLGAEYSWSFEEDTELMLSTYSFEL